MTDGAAAVQKLTPSLRYGIELRPLTDRDLERVRQWRNDPQIAGMMVDQRYISPEQHQAGVVAQIRELSRSLVI